MADLTPSGSARCSTRASSCSVLLRAVGSTLQFDYDFGDSWEHDVVVEAIKPVERGVMFPRCTAGRCACPPEDSELLGAHAAPRHERHEELKDWMGGEFDPDDFDGDETTEAIQLQASLHGW